MPAVISRTEARTLGLTRYFTGRPCQHNHLTERFVSNRTCLECTRILRRKYRKTHKKKECNYMRRWRANLSKNPHSEKISLNIARIIINQAKQNSKRHGLEVDLQPQNLLPLPTHCPVFGYELTYLAPRDSRNCIPPHAASLDRIDNKKKVIF